MINRTKTSRRITNNEENIDVESINVAEGVLRPRVEIDEIDDSKIENDSSNTSHNDNTSIVCGADEIEVEISDDDTKTLHATNRNENTSIDKTILSPADYGCNNNYSKDDKYNIHSTYKNENSIDKTILSPADYGCNNNYSNDDKYKNIHSNYKNENSIDKTILSPADYGCNNNYSNDDKYNIHSNYKNENSIDKTILSPADYGCNNNYLNDDKYNNHSSRDFSFSETEYDESSQIEKRIEFDDFLFSSTPSHRPRQKSNTRMNLPSGNPNPKKKLCKPCTPIENQFIKFSPKITSLDDDDDDAMLLNDMFHTTMNHQDSNHDHESTDNQEYDPFVALYIKAGRNLLSSMKNMNSKPKDRRHLMSILTLNGLKKIHAEALLKESGILKKDEAISEYEWKAAKKHAKYPGAGVPILDLQFK